MGTFEFLAMVGRRALANSPTTQNSYDLAARAIKAGIPGDFVETGIYAGAQCAAMARAILDARMRAIEKGWAGEDPNRTGFGPHRVIHGFDSFEGIPMAGPNDAEQPGDPQSTDRSGDLRSSGISACTVLQVLSHWEAWGLPRDLLALHKGWFQETVANWSRMAPTRSIAVLRLDGDLYESTRVCLEALYPHVSSGGFVIIDDYALAGCRKAVDEYMLGERGGPMPSDARGSGVRVVKINGGGGPVWWRKP